MSSLKSMLPTAAFSTGKSRTSTGSTLTEESWRVRKIDAVALRRGCRILRLGRAGLAGARRRFAARSPERPSSNRPRPPRPKHCGDDRRSSGRCASHARSHGSDRGQLSIADQPRHRQDAAARSTVINHSSLAITTHVKLPMPELDDTLRSGRLDPASHEAIYHGVAEAAPVVAVANIAGHCCGSSAIESWRLWLGEHSQVAPDRK